MSLDLFEEYAVDCVQGLLAINLPGHCGRWNEAQILGGDDAEDHLLFEQFLTHFCIVRLIVVSGVIEALVGFPQHWHTSSDKNQGGCLPKLFRADEAGLIVLYHNVLTWCFLPHSLHLMVLVVQLPHLSDVPADIFLMILSLIRVT